MQLCGIEIGTLDPDEIFDGEKIGSFAREGGKEENGSIDSSLRSVVG